MTQTSKSSTARSADRRVTPAIDLAAYHWVRMVVLHRIGVAIAASRQNEAAHANRANWSPRARTFVRDLISFTVWTP